MERLSGSTTALTDSLLSVIQSTLTCIGGTLASLLSAPVSVFPVFPSSLFNWSLLAGFVFMAASAWVSGSFFREFSLCRTPWLDTVTAYVDPFLVQLCWTVSISGILTLLAQAAHDSASSRPIRVAKVTVTALVPLGVLVGSFVIGDVLYKPALGYDRPQDHLNETGLTALVLNLFHRTEGGDAAPSGFLLRQVALFLFAWLVLEQPLVRRRFRRLVRLLLHLGNLAALIFVGFSRFYRGAHRLFDLSLSIGIGLVVVWTLIILMYQASSRRHQYAFFTVAASNLALIGFLFYYARAPELLIRNAGYILTTFGTYYLFVEAFARDNAPRWDS